MRKQFLLVLALAMMTLTGCMWDSKPTHDEPAYDDPAHFHDREGGRAGGRR
jgi:hypothetical protein